MNNDIYTAALRVARDAVTSILSLRLANLEADSFVEVWEMTSRALGSPIPKIYPMSRKEDWVRAEMSDPMQLLRTVSDKDIGFNFEDDYIACNASGEWFTFTNHKVSPLPEELADAMWYGWLDTERGIVDAPDYWDALTTWGAGDASLNPADILKELAGENKNET